MPYKEIASGLSYHIRRIGSAKCTEVGEMKTAIRKSYRSKTLRLMNNTMTDTPPVIPYFIRGRFDSGVVAGPGVGVEPGGRLDIEILNSSCKTQPQPKRKSP